LHDHEFDNTVPKNPWNDRYKTGEGYHVVAPPYTGTFLPPKPDLVFNDDPNDSEPVPIAVTQSFVKSPWPFKHIVNKAHSPCNPQQALKDKGVIDSGCSRYMTGNIYFLSDFEEIDGGYVAFGGNPKGEFKNKTLAKFFDEAGITQQFSAVRTPQQNGVMERRNRTLVEAARTMLTFVNLPSFFWAEAIATACFTQNRLIIHKRFDKTPYELMNKRKPNIKFFRVFGCRCYLLNDYEDVGKLKAKEDIRVFIGYSKESAAFRIYNKQTRKIHESVNVNFDEISKMASKQFSLEPGLFNLNEMGKSSNPSVSQVTETSKKDLEDLFYNFYDEYFDSSKIMKSSTTYVETSINEKVFHEVSESFQGESFSSSLNDDVQQSPKK
nr:retrovirus-related Pol polyprotein from transposon TNT 1-94 [Tanacetum cinerariifolium]